MGLAEVIAVMKEYGIFEFYLPFMLMFGILYGLLAKSQIFGNVKEKTPRAISLLVSLFASLFLMIYTPIGITLTTFLSNLFGTTLVVVLSILAFLAVLYVISAIVGPGAAPPFTKGAIPYLSGLAIIAAIILAIGVFISSGGTAIFPGIVWAPFPGVIPVIPGLTAQDIAIIVVAILTLIVIWWVIRVPPEKKE